MGKGQGHPSFHKPECTKWGPGALHIYTSQQHASWLLILLFIPFLISSSHILLSSQHASCASLWHSSPLIVVLFYVSLSVQMPVKVWLRPQRENGCVFWSICGVWTASLKLEMDALKGKRESHSWIAPHSTQLRSRSCLFAWFHWQVNSVKWAPMRYRRINNLFGCYALFMLWMCVYVHAN